MRKILTIAAREYRAMVGTKAFLISISMMPILMFGGIFAMSLLQNVGEVSDRKIAVLDQSGMLFDHLKSEAEKRNELLESASSGDDQPFGDSARYRYLLEAIDVEEVTDELRLELSDRVRDQEMYAFVEIPAEIFGEDAKSLATAVKFYSQNSSLSDARGWFSQQINQRVKQKRLENRNIDVKAVQAASTPVRISGLGLLAKSASGEIEGAEEKSELMAIFLPMGIMMLMFMVIFLAAQPMLESVLEEKSQRIAEVLLGSANPFQLMSGKLIGTVAGSITVFALYFVGALFVAKYKGWYDVIPFEIAPWFVVFQILGVMFFGSIFMAVGASVSQLKEAQSMLLPVWMVMMSPMFIWFMIVREPNSALATGFSFFPPATPTTMVLRMATGQTIPLWQPILGLIILIAATLLVVIIAGRIFRVGLLWQGKTPKINEIMKWALRG